MLAPSSSDSLSLLPLLLLLLLMLLRRRSVGDRTRTGVCRRTIFEITRLFFNLLCLFDRLPVL